MSDELINFQNEVKEYLEKHGIMKKWLAEQLGISPGMLSHWFAGRTSFPRYRIEKIKQLMEQ